MKLLFSILFSFPFISAPQIFSQNYEPMAVEGAHWLMFEIDENGPDHHFFKICGDTTINGLEYKKMYRENLTSQATASQDFGPPFFSDEIILYGAIRDDVPARQVYFYPFENFGFAYDTCETLKDLLLHDFSKSMGDTLPGCLYGYPDMPAVVNNTGTEILWGIERKFFECDCGARLVEGVGTDMGPFYPLPGFIHPAKPQFLADYFIETNENCPPQIFSSTEEGFRDAGISIYPNPATDHLTIRFEPGQTSPFHISLSDIMGKKVWESTILPQAGTTVPMGNLPNGTYLLTLRNDQFSITKKIRKT